jgi:predicted transcriptional regulator
MKRIFITLSRRERQIMDVVYQQGRVSVADVHEALPDAPSYSAVRALLRILEEKGHLSHTEDGKRYLYAPTQPRPQAARSALNQIVQTFFGGSVERAVTTLLSSADTNLSAEELERLAALIDQAKEGGRS